MIEFERVYLVKCRQRNCVCHRPLELCECLCALCKARRWERVTRRRLQRRTSTHAAGGAPSPARAPPCPLPPKPPTPTNRELAERALNGVRDEAPPPRVSAAKILADALLSPLPPPPASPVGAASELVASGASVMTSVSPRAARSSRSPTRPSPLDCREPAASPASTTLVRAAWLSPERLHQARELEASKLHAEAEAARAVQAAFEFMLKHSR